ncbi:MAG: AAA family ATPase [Acidimicrobiales bacterium]
MRVPKVLVMDPGGLLGEQLDSVTADLRPRPAILYPDATAAIEDVVEANGPFEVIVAGPEVSSEEGLAQLRRLRMQAPNSKLILAFQKWPTHGLRDTVRLGAFDIIRLPVSDKVLLESVQQAIELAVDEDLPAASEKKRPRKGTVVAVVSATGGCGKTFFATNLAYSLEARAQRRTCLIDLDLQFGELSTALRLRPKSTIADLVGQNEDSEVQAAFESYVVRHETGIHVLAAPDEPVDADSVAPADIVRVIEAAKSLFDYVVLDTSAALSETVIVALENAEAIFAMATLDLPSVRNLGVLLSVMKKLKMPVELVNLVMNKVEPDVGMDIERVARYFPQGFSMVIPYGREVNRALNMGMPMLAFSPGSPVSKAIEAGLGHTVEVLAPEAVAENGRRHRIRRRRKQPV